jgi:hypothetical protein
MHQQIRGTRSPEAQHSTTRTATPKSESTGGKKHNSSIKFRKSSFDYHRNPFLIIRRELGKEVEGPRYFVEENERLKRTTEVFDALARYVPIVPENWVLDCTKAKRFLFAEPASTR